MKYLQESLVFRAQLWSYHHNNLIVKKWLRLIIMHQYNKIILIIGALSAHYAQAQVIVSPFFGYIIGGEVEDQASNEYDLKASSGYGLAIETDYEKGRIGLFYATQNTSVETINTDANIHYLHFQSSIYYPTSQQLTAYIGLGIGGSYTDVDWAKDKYGFSSSLFGGFEYAFTDNIALNSQVRWLGTSVDNETSETCTLPSSETCAIRFKSDWINQFSANIGLTVRF
ncbi:MULTISPECIES: outer membrane beta-barrel protein [unclassified Vibrio]|uniref:outer membrane beta-barrel protein n=1 Tax=unclassified Vibrio TaxID=2614977 RepID=UPI000B8E9D3F|nr:outer membrane beta-barrel protein [Vibrio sp. V24_P1S3T111]OXX24058.1 hypothetical protein B9J88_06425 [Vibrio sp. V05_P4A8T149]OXX27660.1 hypothetical protein B9J86_01375 [Vibrio sp. V06_P1A73T115]OXX29005.1 hypothetical protein B9J95_14555 [Vibrio sp. V14_P6S14T42]OXX33156.1 hypothetical protein B9J81_11020 [Vibrio sp. V04_P4A5T148]OXX53422.1 hypothetical protein B9J91_13510 [Vibrio sp. V18_P1S4T112]